MKIAIDCRHLYSSGIGSYLKGCLPYFLNSDNDFILLCNYNNLFNIKNHKNAKIISCSVKPFSLKDTFFFPKKIIKEINSCNFFFSPYFNISNGIKIPIFTTIHDIIFPDMPELTSFLGLKARMYFYKRCFRLSKKIFTVSNFSKTRINLYSKNLKPVIVTYNASQSYFHLKNNYNGKSIKKEYILFIGNIKKHKGLDYFLDAYYEAIKNGLKHKLIIVGNADNFRSKYSDFQNKLKLFKDGEVTFSGYLSDDKLANLLSEASLLVQPSLYEGFGLPPLEALNSGTLALISDIPVFREIYNGFPVVFFKAGDTTDLKNKLLLILLNNKAQKISIPEELQNKYTFEKTANIILNEILCG